LDSTNLANDTTTFEQTSVGLVCAMVIVLRKIVSSTELANKQYTLLFVIYDFFVQETNCTNDRYATLI
jgi:hypothetical protein